MDLWRRRVSPSFLKPKSEFKATKLGGGGRGGEWSQTQTGASRIQVIVLNKSKAIRFSGSADLQMFYSSTQLYLYSVCHNHDCLDGQNAV